MRGANTDDRRIWRAMARAAALIGALALSSCSVAKLDPTAAKLSPPPVGAATDEWIEDDRYRVIFIARGDYTRAERQAGVLRRAAELTLEMGFEHFVVRERESLYDNPPPDTFPELGVGVGVFGGSSSGVGAGVSIGGLPSQRGGRATGEAAVIELRQGPAPQDSEDAYDARVLLKQP